MASEKLVDGDFLSKLLAGSYEVAMGATEEVVAENAELFGSEADDVQVIGTFAEHLIVANTEGGFYRAKWGLDENNAVFISDVEEIDVPVFEANTSLGEARRQAESTVVALLSEDEDGVKVGIGNLLDMVQAGTRLTAESVEDLFEARKEQAEASDWLAAIREHGDGIRKFVGRTAHRLQASVPHPRFEAITGGSVDEADADPHRSAVRQALIDLRDRLQAMRGSIALAKQIGEDHVLTAGEDGGLATGDFVQFVEGYSADLDSTIDVVEDAVSVAEDGCVSCLARVHDGIAEHLEDWALAAAFSEKLARRFEPPKAA